MLCIWASWLVDNNQQSKAQHRQHLVTQGGDATKAFIAQQTCYCAESSHDYSNA